VVVRLSAALLAALAVALVATAGSTAAGNDRTPYTCDEQNIRYHIDRADELLKHGYSHRRWEDATPLKKLEREAIQQHKFCLKRKADRKVIAERRGELADKFAEYRMWRASVPYTGGGQRWALPYYIVVCESGADYHVGFAGAYGLLTATWAQWGGPALAGTSTAGAAAPKHQDIIAHRVWTDVGPSGWECA